LAVSGLPADDFVFAGFAPSRSKDRIAWFMLFAHESRPIVFFEAPHRIRKTLDELPFGLGERPIMIGRELTKRHEEILRTSTSQAGTLKFTEKGEFTIVLGPRVASIEHHQHI